MLPGLSNNIIATHYWWIPTHWLGLTTTGRKGSTTKQFIIFFREKKRLLVNMVICLVAACFLFNVPLNGKRIDLSK